MKVVVTARAPIMDAELCERVERARIYTQKQLLNMLREQGFMLLKAEYMMPPLDGLKHGNFAAVLRKFLRRLEVT